MSEEDCKQCLSMMGRIDGQITTLVSSNTKIMYAMLGIIGANIGTKFIGTPWYVELTMYALMFSAVFVFCLTLKKIRCLSWWEKWSRFSFVTLACWVTFLRIYHYQTDTPFTQMEGIITQLLTMSMAIGWIMSDWHNTKKKRRKDDYQRTGV